MCKNSSLRNLTHVSISKFVLDRIFVCDKHKILFCQTPKVGNTQWKKVLIVLNGEYESKVVIVFVFVSSADDLCDDDSQERSPPWRRSRRTSFTTMRRTVCPVSRH